MTLEKLIHDLIELKIKVGGDTEVEVINVNENTASPDDGGGTFIEWESLYFIEVKDGVIKLGRWDEYYST